MHDYESQIELIEKEVDGVKNWFKIRGDDAFVDIIDGWKLHGKKAYLDPVKDFDVVVQAGGYCGIFPRLLSQRFKMVYTFEPDPLNFYCLVKNNPLDNVIKIQGALGDKHKPVSVIRRVESNRGMHQVEERPRSCIPQFRIDDLNLAACDFIQLDTEGFEYRILLGGFETIRNHKPLISVEDTTTDIENLLFPLGYRKLANAYRDTIYGT